MLDWNSDSAEKGWGAVDAVDTTAGGGRGAANKGGGNVECVDADECNVDIDVIAPGGGVGLVIVFVAGDNCVLQLKLKENNFTILE